MRTDAEGQVGIVIVTDDDSDDFTLVCDAWEEVSPSVDVVHAENGQRLFEVLTGGAGERPVVPALILLDLNMPVVDGWEALASLKEHRVFKSIPTVIFTTSSVPEHVRRAYEMQAAGFVTKPLSYRDLVDSVSSLDKYWFTTVACQHEALGR
jgi:CheY-like chemotaxis protein